VNALERWFSGALVLAGLLVVAALGVHRYGLEQYGEGYDAALEARAGADTLAVAKRADDNQATAARQAASNATITEKKHEEIQPVRERIVTQRVYVGAAVCGERPAVPAEAEGAAGGDVADSARRLVREDVERDIRALKLQVEEHLATARACQQVLRDEGMAP